MGNSVTMIGALSEHASHRKDDDTPRTLGRETRRTHRPRKAMNEIESEKMRESEGKIEVYARIARWMAVCTRGDAARAAAWRRAAGSTDAAAARRKPRAGRPCSHSGSR